MSTATTADAEFIHPTTSQLVRAVFLGGLAAAILDSIDAIIAYKVAFGFNPVSIYQFVASGLLGQSAFAGGIPTALLGVLIHLAIAFSAAGVFSVASLKLEPLRTHFILAGIGFGFLVYAFMSYLVIPLSAIPPSPFSLPLLVNGLAGHALFVGLPIAFFARRATPCRCERP